MGAAVMWEAGRGRHWCKNEIVQMWDDAHPQLASLSRPPVSVRSVKKNIGSGHTSHSEWKKDRMWIARTGLALACLWVFL